MSRLSKASPSLIDSDWYEVVKSVIRARVDRGIAEASDFLDRNETYFIDIQPDPLKTNSIWFISLCTKPYAPRLMIATAIDCRELLAGIIAKHLSMLLMVMGFSVQDSKDSDIELTDANIRVMREWEGFFISSSTISVDLRYQDNVFSIVCESNGREIEFVELPGLSTKGAWILTKQFTMLLASLGKYVETADHTIGNRYGLVEFAPGIADGSEEDE